MIAVLRPLRYEQLLTKHRCYIIIVSIWVVSAALAASRWILTVTWNMNFCMYRLEAGNRIISSYVLVTYLFSFLIPAFSLIYATVRIFLVVVRADSQVSAQVQSISGGADEAGLVTLNAIRSAKNVLIICFVAVAFTVQLFLQMSIRHVFFDVHMSIRHVFFDVQAMTVFSFVAIYLCVCNTFMYNFLYMVLHRSIRQKLKLMFTSMYESCRSG